MKLKWALLKLRCRNFYRRHRYVKGIAFDNQVSIAAYKDQQIVTLRREMEETKASMDRVVPKLVNLIIERDYSAPSNQYRLVLDLDPFLIRDAFQFGNDKRAIQVLGENVGHMVTRELYTINMHRFGRSPFTSAPGAGPSALRDTPRTSRP